LSPYQPECYPEFFDMAIQKIIIALDGYSSCGKSTTAKIVAARLGYGYIDTGAMYRAVTLYFFEHNISLTNPKEISKALNEIQISFHYNPRTDQNETFLNGVNVEKEIRKMYISDRVSEVSALPEVRHAMVNQQQKMGRKKGIVMDGRDIGTRVFPEAELKLFMTADLNLRAIRRQQELLEKNQLVNLDEIRNNLEHRDRIDSGRKESPLRKAEDAIEIDTSFITIEEQVEMVLEIATSRMLRPSREKEEEAV
jgi:cytidylate kinase